MRYRLIALCSAVLSARCPVLHCSKRGRSQERRQGAFSADRLPGGDAAPGIDVDRSISSCRTTGCRPSGWPLSVAGVPAGWTATLIGNGQPVAAALPATNASVSLELRLDVPKDAPIGTTNLTVNAKGGATDASLPVAVTLATDLPAKLTLTPQLPELRGTSKSNFEFQLAIKNESGKKVVVSLSAQAPQNFDATFTEQYGSQELNALPLDAGQSKDVKLKVRPPNTVAAGKYKVDGKGDRRGRHRDRRARPRHHRPAQDRHCRPRRRAQRQGLGRPGGDDPGDPHQYRHRGRPKQIELSGTAPTRLEGQLRAQDRRPHRAERKQGSAGDGHARSPRPWPAITSPPSALRRAANRPRSPSASRSRPRRCGASSASPSSAVALLVMIGAVVWFGRR